MAKRSWTDSTPETETDPSELLHPTSSPVTMPSPVSPSSSPQHKYLHVDKTEGAGHVQMQCSLPPHRGELTFATYVEYESHYLQTHVNRCSECMKNFPSDLFLTRHIEENHDPVMEARKERGEKTFGCFVEGCERRCSTPQKRRMHLIDKHCFPRGYNFYIVNDGIDRYSSLLRTGVPMHRRRFSLDTGSVNAKNNTMIAPTSPQRRRKHTLTRPVAPENEDQEADDGLASLTQSMSALKFVPHSVTMRRQNRNTS